MLRLQERTGPWQIHGIRNSAQHTGQRTHLSTLTDMQELLERMQTPDKITLNVGIPITYELVLLLRLDHFCGLIFVENWIQFKRKMTNTIKTS